MSPVQHGHEWLPTLPEELTANWFGSKLAHKVKSAEQTRVIWGTASKLFFTLTYEDGVTKDRATHICVKGMFDPAMVAAQPWTVSLTQHEANFFSKLAPGVTRMGYPKCWWAGTSADQGLVIMNDLNTELCIFKEMTDIWTVEQVLEGVEQLAGLHAQYWGATPKSPYETNVYDPAMQFLCAPWTETVNSPDRPYVPDEFKDGKRFNRLHDKYFLTRNPKFQTLLHGDTHVGNTYFTSDGHPRWLDWSAYHVGSCFHDVSYFIAGALSVADRRQHDMRILQHYLDALHRFGAPQFKNTDEDVLVEFRRSFIANCIWIVCPYGLQPKESVAALCERTVAAWQDHKVLEVIEAQPEPVNEA